MPRAHYAIRGGMDPSRRQARPPMVSRPTTKECPASQREAVDHFPEPEEAAEFRLAPNPAAHGSRRLVWLALAMLMVGLAFALYAILNHG